MYVSDVSNCTIRKITPASVVSTLAGSAGTSGSAARFYYPGGVCVDSLGNVYVADSNNNTVRKVTPAGVVSTLAGLAGSSGSADGAGSAARFYLPIGLGLDSSGNLYVGDTYNQTIRKITPGGTVDALAGAAGTSGSADGTGSAARFQVPSGLCVDGEGRVYVADTYNHTIRRSLAAPVITSPTTASGTVGVAFSYQITASNSPTSYNAANLPSWASVDTGTGAIAGTPNVPGLANVTIKATNAVGTGSAPLVITVNRRSITVTAASDSKTYDGTTSSAGVPTITSGTLAAGDSASWTQTFDTKNAGTGKTLTPAGTVNDGNGGNNYSVTFVSVTSGVINARPITVTADVKTKVYGAALPELTYTYSGLVNGDTLATFTGALATTATASSDVGIYPITQDTLAATGNYSIVAYNGANLTVDAAPLTVVADAQSKVYGAALPELTYWYTGLVNKDTAATFTGALATTATASPSVGTYPITQGTLVATGNYGLGTFSGANLTISPARATVKLGDLTQKYDGSPKTVSASTDPDGLAVTLTYNGSTTAPTDVGSYAVVGTISDLNYQGSASGTLTIEPAGSVATPEFSPAAGTYIGAQSLTISCATSGATIYYTTDGSTPSTSAARYSAPVSVSAAITVKAYAMKSGWVDSALASAAYIVYVPNSGGSGAPTPNTNTTAANPVGGVSVTVTYTDGGVVELQVSLNGGALPAGYAATTIFQDGSGNILGAVQGAQPIYRFTGPGMYLAVVTVTDAQGNTAGDTELALPISASETGIAQGMTPTSSMAISAVSLKGKLLFNASKADTVTFKGTIELAAGLDLSKPQTLSVAIGNVLDTANLDLKGKAKAGAMGRLKNVAVKYPRLQRPATTTSAGQQATVSFTLSAPQLDLLGFDCTGVSKQGGVAGQSVQRTIWAALLLGGTAYRGDVPVTWKLSKKGDHGQLTAKK